MTTQIIAQSTWTVADCAQNRSRTITAADDAAALKQVYETLTEWNDDEEDCAEAIVEGVIYVEGHKRPDPIYLDRDPRNFWMRAAELMCNDNQDFAEGDRVWAED